MSNLFPLTIINKERKNKEGITKDSGKYKKRANGITSSAPNSRILFVLSARQGKVR